MDDILKFLLIAGVILIGVFREANKNKSKKAQNQRPNPSIPPTTEAVPDDAPFPQTWGKMFPSQDIFQPILVEKPATPSPQNKNPKKQAPESMPRSGSRLAAVTDRKSMQTSDTEASKEAEEDFTIHSAEEARKAIIWGEILQRKY